MPKLGVLFAGEAILNPGIMDTNGLLYIPMTVLTYNDSP